MPGKKYKKPSATEEYRRAVCAACPAGLACVTGLTRTVLKCHSCGKMWAVVYMLNEHPSKATTRSTFSRTRDIPILATHFEVCPLRDRIAEDEFGVNPMQPWQGVECDECCELRHKQKLLDKQRKS